MMIQRQTVFLVPCTVLLILALGLVVATAPGCREARRDSRRSAIGQVPGQPSSAVAPAVTTASGPAVPVYVAPTSSQVAIGEPVVLEVGVGTLVTDLYGMALDVQYDPLVLEFVSAQHVSQFLGQAQGYQEFKNGQPGRLVLAVTKAGEVPGDAGQGTLLRLLFRSLGTGQAGFRVGEVGMFDSQGRILPVALGQVPGVLVQ